MFGDPRKAAMEILAKRKLGVSEPDETDAGLDSAVDDLMEAFATKNGAGVKAALRSFLIQHSSRGNSDDDQPDTDTEIKS